VEKNRRTAMLFVTAVILQSACTRRVPRKSGVIPARKCPVVKDRRYAAVEKKLFPHRPLPVQKERESPKTWTRRKRRRKGSPSKKTLRKKA